MDWAANARHIMAEQEERREFLLAYASMPTEDRAWINRHLDMAFEGRRDHLRPTRAFDRSLWVS